MSDQIEELIQEIAQKHGIAVGRNDPILARLPQLEAKNNTNPLIYRPWG
jgi:ketopantoate reductase